LLISFSSIPFFIYCILDTMVSLKYETDGNSSVSEVSGKDLSIPINIFFSLAIMAFIVFILLLIFRKKILKWNKQMENTSKNI